MHDLLCSSFVAAVLSRILPESTLLENALRKKSLRFFNWMIDAANVRARRVTEKHRRKNNPLSRIDEAEGEQNRGSGLIRAPKSARPIISYRAAVRLSGSSDRRTLGGAGRFEIAMCDLKLGPRQGRDSAAQRAGAPQPGTVSRGFCVSALAGEMGLFKTAKRLDELESRLERKLATHDQVVVVTGHDCSAAPHSAIIIASSFDRCCYDNAAIETHFARSARETRQEGRPAQRAIHRNAVTRGDAQEGAGAVPAGF